MGRAPMRKIDKKRRSLTDISVVNRETEKAESTSTSQERRPSLADGGGPSYGSRKGPPKEAEDNADDEEEEAEAKADEPLLSSSPDGHRNRRAATTKDEPDLVMM